MSWTNTRNRNISFVYFYDAVSLLPFLSTILNPPKTHVDSVAAAAPVKWFMNLVYRWTGRLSFHVFFPHENLNSLVMCPLCTERFYHLLPKKASEFSFLSSWIVVNEQRCSVEVRCFSSSLCTTLTVVSSSFPSLHFKNTCYNTALGALFCFQQTKSAPFYISESNGRVNFTWEPVPHEIWCLVWLEQKQKWLKFRKVFTTGRLCLSIEGDSRLIWGKCGNGHRINGLYVAPVTCVELPWSWWFLQI